MEGLTFKRADNSTHQIDIIHAWFVVSGQFLTATWYEQRKRPRLECKLIKLPCPNYVVEIPVNVRDTINCLLFYHGLVSFRHAMLTFITITAW